METKDFRIHAHLLFLRSPLALPLTQGCTKYQATPWSSVQFPEPGQQRPGAKQQQQDCLETQPPQFAKVLRTWNFHSKSCLSWNSVLHCPNLGTQIPWSFANIWPEQLLYNSTQLLQFLSSKSLRAYQDIVRINKKKQATPTARHFPGKLLHSCHAQQRRNPRQS